MYLFINRGRFYWTTIHLWYYLHNTISSVVMKLGAKATTRSLLHMHENIFLFLCFCLVSFVLTFFPSFSFYLLSPPSRFSPSQVVMLCGISIFLPLFPFFSLLSCFLYLFISSFHVTVVSSSLCFCPFLFVRHVLIPAECLLNPLCPSACTRRTREPLLITAQRLMFRIYLMSWLNLIAVKIGHITHTLQG